MTYPEFMQDAEVQKAAAAYSAKFGGRFVCEEPGDRLVYLSVDGAEYVNVIDGKKAVTTRRDDFLAVLNKGIASSSTEDLLASLWYNWDDEPVNPDILY